MSLCGSERHSSTWPDFALHVVEREGRVFEQIDLAVDQDALARGALALLAAMRQGDALAEGGVEDGLAFLDPELDVDRQKANRVRVAHRAPVSVVGIGERVGAASGPHRRGRSVAGVDGEARAVLGEVLLALLGRHLAQQRAAAT